MSGFDPTQPRSGATGRWIVPSGGETRQDRTKPKKPPRDRREEAAQLSQISAAAADRSGKEPKRSAAQRKAVRDALRRQLGITSSKAWSKLSKDHKKLALEAIRAAQTVATLKARAEKARKRLAKLKALSQRRGMMGSASQYLVRELEKQQERINDADARVRQAQTRLTAARRGWNNRGRGKRKAAASTATKGEPTHRVLVKVGPKGYIHGWVYVGPQMPGARVRHPEHGEGVVSRRGKRTIGVRYENGEYESYEHKPETPTPEHFTSRTERTPPPVSGKPQSVDLPAQPSQERDVLGELLGDTWTPPSEDLPTSLPSEPKPRVSLPFADQKPKRGDLIVTESWYPERPNERWYQVDRASSITRGGDLKALTPLSGGGKPRLVRAPARGVQSTHKVIPADRVDVDALADDLHAKQQFGHFPTLTDLEDALTPHLRPESPPKPPRKRSPTAVKPGGRKPGGRKPRNTRPERADLGNVDPAVDRVAAEMRLAERDLDQLAIVWAELITLPPDPGRDLAIAALDREIARREGKPDLPDPLDTPQARRVDELVGRGWSYTDAYADAHGLDPTQLDREQRNALIDANRRPGERRRETLRRMYTEQVHMQYLQAEEETAGNLLSAEGRRKGIDPTTLWSGSAATARRYASEELKRWWEEHGGRPTWTQYQAQYGTRTERQTARAQAQAGAGRDFGL